MPARPSFTGAFAAVDSSTEVICPLRNQDGSNCRKRCLGEKRYRSMQEHIRRAHPHYYIPKLPATEESFQLMITSPPSEKPVLAVSSTPHQPKSAKISNHYDRNLYGDRKSGGHGRHEEQFPAATAAVALAQLHTHKTDSDWDSETDYSEPDDRRTMMPSVELPSIRNHLGLSSQLPSFHSPRSRELLPSVMAHSPPERSSTLPPIHRHETDSHVNGMGSGIVNGNGGGNGTKKDKLARMRKSSLVHGNGVLRKSKHEKSRSRDLDRRMSIEGRKAFSAEPPGAYDRDWVKSKRWEDLIEAATSATEADSDRDITPIPQSPNSKSRASMPPYTSVVSHLQPYKASPLARTLTPPPSRQAPGYNGSNGFSSGETSGVSIESKVSKGSSNSTNTSMSGSNFHMLPSGLMSTSNSATKSETNSPTYYQTSKTLLHGHGHGQDQFQNTSLLHETASSHPHPHAYPHLHSQTQSSITSSAPSTRIKISCASCHRLNAAQDSFACTACISGFCADCVNSLTMKRKRQPTNTETEEGQTSSVPSLPMSLTSAQPFMDAKNSNVNDAMRIDGIVEPPSDIKMQHESTESAELTDPLKSQESAESPGSSQNRPCPRCKAPNSQYMPVQLDLRAC